MTTNKNQDPATPKQEDHLDQFMSAVISFAKNVGEAGTKAAGGEGEADLIQHNAALVTQNFERVHAFMQENRARLSRQDDETLNEFLMLTGGVSMVTSGEKLAVSKLSSARVGKGVLGWISEYLTEIKKIIGFILGLFNGGKPPRWWTKLEQLIDEIWNMLVKLLGLIFGFDTSQLARELSQGEVNYLNEQAAAARLQAEYDRYGQNDDD